MGTTEKNQFATVVGDPRTIATCLASMVGAREKYAEEAVAQTSSSSEDAGESPVSQGPAEKPNPTITWGAGLVALGMLVTCLVMAIGVAGSSIDSFTSEHSWFRTWLIVPTLIYFVAGTLYLREIHKGKQKP